MSLMLDGSSKREVATGESLYYDYIFLGKEIIYIFITYQEDTNVHFSGRSIFRVGREHRSMMKQRAGNVKIDVDYKTMWEQIATDHAIHQRQQIKLSFAYRH